MADWAEKFAKYCNETAEHGVLEADEIEEACENLDGGKLKSQMCYIDGKLANLAHCPESNDATHLQVRYVLNRNCQGFI